MAQVNMPKSSIGQQPAAEPQKKFQKVVKGKVTLKEQNDIQKIANEFLAEDLKTVKNRIVVDYLLPMLKNGLWSIFNSAVSIALFGEDRSRGSSSNYSGSRTQRNSYDTYYQEAPATGRGIRTGPQDAACRTWTLSSVGMQTTRFPRCMMRFASTVRLLWVTCGI